MRDCVLNHGKFYPDATLEQNAFTDVSNGNVCLDQERDVVFN